MTGVLLFLSRKGVTKTEAATEHVNYMKNIFLILLCLALAGCATAKKDNKLETLEGQVSELEGSILKKDAEISRLQNSLKDSFSQLKEREQQIKELKEKLSVFGVF